jgi:hypothetical protein
VVELPAKVFIIHVYNLYELSLFRNEPEKAQNWPPSRYDFSSLDNVVMSPHRGGGLHTPEVEEQRYVDLEEIIQNIGEKGWESIRSHPNIYDSSLGY